MLECSYLSKTKTSMSEINSTRHKRDAEATMARILAAAKSEFAGSGYGGARIDVIAQRAEANKRMIYHYFGNKEALFSRVLEEAYLDIRRAEQELDLEHLPVVEALERLVRFTWQYYLDNPEFLNLVNSANLHKAVHIKDSAAIKRSTGSVVHTLAKVLERGAQEGVFKENVNAVQLYISIAAIGYYYLTNRYTGSIIYQRDFMQPEALDERLQFNLETILSVACKGGYKPSMG